MTTGEYWVSSPLFPVLIWILAAWVLFATVVSARNWFRLLKVERYAKLLETLATEGVGNVAKQIRELKTEFHRDSPKSKRRRRKKRNSKHARSEESRIRSETSEQAATEEVRENGDHVTVASIEGEKGTESRSTETIATHSF